MLARNYSIHCSVYQLWCYGIKIREKCIMVGASINSFV